MNGWRITARRCLRGCTAPGAAAVYVRRTSGCFLISLTMFLRPCALDIPLFKGCLTTRHCCWVRSGQVPGLYRRLAAAGLVKPGAGTITDVTSCPGAESCRLAVTQSRGLARLIEDNLQEQSAKLLRDTADVRIKISGCPNGCGQHHVAAIGFQGSIRKIGNRVECGGSTAKAQQQLAERDRPDPGRPDQAEALDQVRRGAHALARPMRGSVPASRRRIFW